MINRKKIVWALLPAILCTLLFGSVNPLPAFAEPSPSVEATANNSAELKNYIADGSVSVINLVGGRAYTFDGGNIGRQLTINGNGAEILTGAGVPVAVVSRDNTVLIPTTYSGQGIFNITDGGRLILNNITLRNDGHTIISVLNVQEGGELEMDAVKLKEYFGDNRHANNAVNPAAGLNFGVHSDPGTRSKVAVTNSEFDSSNAFREAVNIRGGAASIKNNRFTGTAHPERLRDSDGFEYAIFLYGGTSIIENNIIDGYDAHLNTDYSSSGLAIVAYYDTTVTFTGNTVTNNSIGVDITNHYPAVNPNAIVTLNGHAMNAADPAGRGMYDAKKNNTVQNNGKDMFSEMAFYTKPYTYNDPQLSVSSVTYNSAALVFEAPTSEATSIKLQQSKDGGMLWTDAETGELNGQSTSAVAVNLDAQANYVFRLVIVGGPGYGYSNFAEAATPAAPAVTGVSVTPSSATIVQGDSTQLTAAVAAVGGASEAVTWTSSDNSGKVAVDGTGKVTTAGDAAPGSYTIAAASEFDSGKSATATITVNARTYPVTVSPGGSATGVEVLVNGKAETAGTATAGERGGQTLTTIVVDQGKLNDKLAAEETGVVVTIPVSQKSDIIVGELNGQMVKNMEQKQAVLVLKTNQAAYTVPAQQINIEEIAKRLGSSAVLQDIKIQIEIAAPTDETVKLAQNAADKNTFALVAPPVQFVVRGVFGSESVEITNFNVYVERTIAIPDGADPSKITTGVVIEPDGSVRHVPTKVVRIDGTYYAKINSLTNSTYSVVWHPLEFADAAGHWAEKAINNMGSRLVIEGVGSGLFDPGREITRAEFAAIVVRGLGLRPENGTGAFTDVRASDWHNGAIHAAARYRLIDGFADGTFRPNDKITREQAMAILARAMAITGLDQHLSGSSADDALRPFADAAAAAPWARGSIADSVEAGLITGVSSTALAPKAFITRAEAAAVMQRLLQKSGLI